MRAQEAGALAVIIGDSARTRRGLPLRSPQPCPA